MGLILDTTIAPLLALRTTCMAMTPSCYEIENCPRCHGSNTTWSEFEKHVWCIDCKIDYQPEFNGIFDGPIPIGATQMMGISLDRIEIATGRIITIEEQLQANV